MSIYQIFLDSTNFYEDKVKSTIISSKRQLSEEQVHLILLNFETKKLTQKRMAEIVGVSSKHTLNCIKKGLTYKDYSLTYTKLTQNQKDKLASLLSNK